MKQTSNLLQAEHTNAFDWERGLLYLACWTIATSLNNGSPWQPYLKLNNAVHQAPNKGLNVADLPYKDHFVVHS